MRHPAQGAIGSWVLYYSGFLCVSSHYLIPLRVSSLVVYDLGVSAPTPKAQGLISLVTVNLSPPQWDVPPATETLDWGVRAAPWQRTAPG